MVQVHLFLDEIPYEDKCLTEIREIMQHSEYLSLFYRSPPLSTMLHHLVIIRKAKSLNAFLGVRRASPSLINLDVHHELFPKFLNAFTARFGPPAGLN